MLTNEDFYSQMREIICLMDKYPEKAVNVARAFASVGASVNDFKRLNCFISKGENHAD